PRPWRDAPFRGARVPTTRAPAWHANGDSWEGSRAEPDDAASAETCEAWPGQRSGRAAGEQAAARGRVRRKAESTGSSPRERERGSRWTPRSGGPKPHDESAAHARLARGVEPSVHGL